jgi:hypothetical protein
MLRLVTGHRIVRSPDIAYARLAVWWSLRIVGPMDRLYEYHLTENASEPRGLRRRQDLQKHIRICHHLPDFTLFAVSNSVL